MMMKLGFGMFAFDCHMISNDSVMSSNFLYHLYYTSHSLYVFVQTLQNRKSWKYILTGSNEFSVSKSFYQQLHFDNSKLIFTYLDQTSTALCFKTALYVFVKLYDLEPLKYQNLMNYHLQDLAIMASLFFVKVMYTRFPWLTFLPL